MLASRAYTAADRFTRVVALNVLWLVACVPLVTVGPATAAVFGVVRDWNRGLEPPLARSFLRYFRENFRQAFLLQLMGLVLFLPTGTVVAAILVAVIASYAFTLMVGYDMSLPRILAASVRLAIGSPAATAKTLALLTLTAALTFVFPAAPLLMTAVVASSIQRWCRP
ncbi:putative membrane protein YesL [Kribbella amoyensis]|uniref:Putative membrane protein YesL n=1 Tax=Kribbella amoyensis TaxID=996641 RepID=A0A561C001_9ACTN|nr:YesL family protein [Kribbella amoyensis]TWD84516.1 putative membrane protein YesL [Kribbella amoyensis]